jgi:TrmH family RNA methyltransferase
MTSEVRIVLVEPSHPGNIGSVARAMKNMALEDLVLVRPRTPFPHPEALALAAGADDVLARARTVDTLAEALADCVFVAATTARERSYHWDILTPRDVAARIGALDERARAALLFGPERYGLSNEDLIACNVLVRIPANPLYASLNLAMSVQLIAYEIYVAREQPESRVQLEQPLASGAELELFYRHLQEVLAEIRFEDRTGYLMQRVRRLFNRAQVDANELNILRGILSAVQEGRNQGRRRLSAQTDPP